MPKYETLDAQGNVTNTIVADLAFVEAHHTGRWREIDEPSPAPAVPASITRAQAKSALALAGLLDAVQPAIDAIADPLQRALAQIDWDDRLHFERGNPTLIALSGALGLDDAALDALFVQAAAM